MSLILSVGGSQSFRQQVARAIEVAPDDVEWVASVTAAEETLVDLTDRPQVVVLAPSVKEPDALGLSEFVIRRAPSTAVVMVRDRPVDGLLASAVRAGMRDVVNLSVGGQELKEALERAMEWSRSIRAVVPDAGAQPKAQGKLISVFSSKGGTGKTFTATTVAAALSELSGKATAVVDLDVRAGDVFSYFGREPEHTTDELLSIGDEEDRDRILSLGTKLHDHLWAFGAKADASQESPSGEAMGKVLRTLRSNFAYTVVDSAADYTDQILASFDLADEILLVTGLDVVGVRHLSQAMETLVSIGVPRERFRFVLNRADSKVGLQPSEVEQVMRLKIDSMIPSSRLVPTSLNKGRSLYFTDPGSDVAKAMTALAKQLLRDEDAAAVATQPKKRRFFNRG